MRYDSEEEDMSEVKSQPMPGLCAWCCHAVVRSDSFAVHMTGDDYDELLPGMKYGVLQDMASGEWAVHEVRIEAEDRNELLPMAAVTFVAGTAVCAAHIGSALEKSNLL